MMDSRVTHVFTRRNLNFQKRQTSAQLAESKLICILSACRLPVYQLFLDITFPRHHIIVENLCSQTAATLDPLKPSIRTGSGSESALWLFGQLDKHPQKPLCRCPRNPEQIFKLFFLFFFPCNHHLHTASEEHICQKDRSVRAAVIF